MSDLKLGPYDLDSIVTGDARELALVIPDESVDLIFTDPIYQNIDDYRWLAETAARVLKPGKSLLTMAGNKEKPLLYTTMAAHLQYFWEAAVIYQGANFFMNSMSVQVSWKPILWFVKGKRESAWCKDALIDRSYEKDFGRWQQSPTAAIWFIRQLTKPGDVVVDPFTGFGTFPSACKMLGRRWLAFEINPDTAEQARQRVAETMSPLPGLEISQEALF